MPNKRRFIEEFDELPPVKGQSLLDVFPFLTEQWNYERNLGWGPEHFSFGSNIKVHWKCAVGADHLWQAPVTTVVRSIRDAEVHKCERVGAYGCPFCRGLKVSVTNNLLNLYPEVASQWHASKNTIGPDEVTFGSGRRAWWICPIAHEYQAVISNRTIGGSGCSRCNRGAPTDLRQYPQVLAQFDWANNPGIDPFRLPVGVKVEWICTHDERHKWTAGFYRTTKGERCLWCRGKRAGSAVTILPVDDSTPQILVPF